MACFFEQALFLPLFPRGEGGSLYVYAAAYLSPGVQKKALRNFEKWGGICPKLWDQSDPPLGEVGKVTENLCVSNCPIAEEGSTSSST